MTKQNKKANIQTITNDTTKDNKNETKETTKKESAIVSDYDVKNSRFRKTLDKHLLAISSIIDYTATRESGQIVLYPDDVNAVFNLNSDVFSNSVQQIAYCLTYSVLSKLTGKSKSAVYDETCVKVALDMFNDYAKMEDLNHARMNAYSVGVNKKGNYKRVVEDEKSAKIIREYMRDKFTNLNSWDTFQTATTAVVECIRDIVMEGKPICMNTLEEPFKVTKLSRLVYPIGVTLDESNLKTEEITRLKYLFRVIRNGIESLKGARIGTTQYNYEIDHMNTKEQDYIYFHRYSKYADINGVSNENGVITRQESWNEVMEIINGMQLTKRQRQILSMRLQGYSELAIAQTLGCSQSNIHQHIEKIRKAYNAFTE